MSIKLRHASIDDLKEIQSLFVETIYSVCAKDYNKDQLSAWASSVQNKQRWIDKLKNQYFLIALIDSRIVGFGSLENGDYIDFMYIDKDHQRQGIADKLYTALENESKKQGAKLLKSDVSKTARVFFERKGFSIVSEKVNIMDSVEINNYKMEKSL